MQWCRQCGGSGAEAPSPSFSPHNLHTYTQVVRYGSGAVCNCIKDSVKAVEAPPPPPPPPHIFDLCPHPCYEESGYGFQGHGEVARDFDSISVEPQLGANALLHVRSNFN